MARFSVALLATASLMVLAPAAYANNDGSPEALHAARDACRKELANQKAANKTEQEMQWQRCVKSKLGNKHK